MKKIVLLVALFSSSVYAKKLTVTCEGDGKSIKLISEIKNVNYPQNIMYLAINGIKPDNVEDVSKMPIYKDGVINLSIHYGFSEHNGRVGPQDSMVSLDLVSHIRLNLEKCDNDFERTGSGLLQERVMGSGIFNKTNMKCTCDLR